MCDHCAKMTSQKDYAGQVTCACDRDKKNTKKSKTGERVKEYVSCCDKEGKNGNGNCCGAKNCLKTKEPDNCCKDKKSQNSSTNRKSNINGNTAS